MLSLRGELEPDRLHDRGVEARVPKCGSSSRATSPESVSEKKKGAESTLLLPQRSATHCKTNPAIQIKTRQLSSDTPHLALIDIGLPDISGYEVARSTRQLTSDTKLTLIALTGFGQPTDIEEAKAAGFDDHMVKPIDFACLQAICRQRASVECCDQQ